MYNKRDECGMCCDPQNGVPCDTAIDSCGICFGFNYAKNNPCHTCDIWYSYGNGTCKQDCAGTWGGTKTIGCDGICGSNATCAKTGNNTGSGNAVGAAVGGAIGGVAAIVALGLAAFFAYKYAQKSGLIGKANAQVDFGASNTNPLYETEVFVFQNPLYEE
jgi:hypothetical protein